MIVCFSFCIGEWWNRDIITVQRQAQFTGAAPNNSDAYTINGQPGDLYRCSTQGPYDIKHKRFNSYTLPVK